MNTVQIMLTHQQAVLPRREVRVSRTKVMHFSTNELPLETGQPVFTDSYDVGDMYTMFSILLIIQ